MIPGCGVQDQINQERNEPLLLSSIELLYDLVIRSTDALCKLADHIICVLITYVYNISYNIVTD